MINEIVTIKINKNKLELLITSGALSFDEIEVKNVDVDGFDYTAYEEWELAKKESVKAYKKLKEIEFNIRTK